MGIDTAYVTSEIDKLVAKSRGGIAGCTTRLGELRAKVSAGIHPSKLLLLILTALDITERPLITVAYIAFYLVTGPPALMIESRLVGGQWCTVGTHMPGMELLCAVISAAKKRKKRFADVDYGRPYTTKRR